MIGWDRIQQQQQQQRTMVSVGGRQLSQKLANEKNRFNIPNANVDATGRRASREAKSIARTMTNMSHSSAVSRTLTTMASTEDFPWAWMREVNDIVTSEPFAEPELPVLAEDRLAEVLVGSAVALAREDDDFVLCSLWHRHTQL